MSEIKDTRKRSADSVTLTPKKARLTSSSILHRYSKLPNINAVPQGRTEPLDLFVWGTGSMCELGLGPKANTKEVKRPRLNPLLTPEVIKAEGIVDFAVGGMHVLSLDSNNSVWSWGTNDSKVLGRNTSKAKENLKAIDDGAASDDEDGDLNELESTPGRVENLPKTDSKIVQLAATDNLSAILYQNGDVYTWGTFRSNEGLLGFSKTTEYQEKPLKQKNLKNIVQLAAGKDHMLALDAKGIVYAWGNGQQFQLGRKILERHKFSALEPQQFGLYDIKYIASGDFHCFAIDNNDRVFTWGLNQYGQCGVTNEHGELEDGSVISKPEEVVALSAMKVKEIVGGEHHSLALTESGDVYSWGRFDMKEVGIPEDKLPESTFKDAHGKPRSVPVPTKLTIGSDSVKFKTIGTGSHHSFAVTTDGVVFSWGFGDTYAPGLGPLDGDVDVPTRIFNTATKYEDIKIIGAGGQFSVSAGKKMDEDEAEDRNDKYEDMGV